MSRFSNLELSGESEDPLRHQAADNDEAFYLNEAEAAFRLGRFEPGLRAFAKALEFNSQNAAAWSGQVRMLIELAEFKEAKVWADKGIEKFPHDPELLAAKGVALARMGDFKAALAFSDAAFEERGDTPYLWLARGDVLLARKEKRADYCFERALHSAPADWFWRWLVARVHFFYEQFACALKFAQQALQLDSGQPVVWIQMGQCQAALGLFVPAENSFEQAAQLEPDHTEIDRHLRVLRRNSGFGARLTGWYRRLFSK